LTKYRILSGFRDGGFFKYLRGRDRSETSERRANEGKNRVFEPIFLALTYPMFVKKPLDASTV
jgi:hypothetical protein